MLVLQLEMLVLDRSAHLLGCLFAPDMLPTSTALSGDDGYIKNHWSRARPEVVVPDLVAAFSVSRQIQERAVGPARKYPSNTRMNAFSFDLIICK
jgi:hypothetical protein